MSDKDQPVTPRASASVIIVRAVGSQLEVLLVQRNANIKFHSGAWVFPGGKVDPTDIEQNANGDENSLARIAAIRETQEEVGITLEATALTPFSHWLTPVQQPKRFSTWFFVAAVDGDVNPVIDESEIVDHIWLSPQEALEKQISKELILPPPTFVSLTKLLTLESTQNIDTFVSNLGFEKFAPRIVENDLGRIALYHGDAGFEQVDAEIPGARHRLMMLKSGWKYINS